MKFLCICEGGNVRSHALAFILHDHYLQEALAIGCSRVSKGTLDYFCEWADYVVVMQSKIAEMISGRFKWKIRVFDVGPDRWGIYIHPELLKMVKDVAVEWAKRDFKL